MYCDFKDFVTTESNKETILADNTIVLVELLVKCFGSKSTYHFWFPM